MQRRQLLKSLATLAAGSTAAPWFSQALAGQSPLSIAEQNYQQFHAALEQQPELLGFIDRHREYSNTELNIEGKLPKAIRGVLYRNGPALLARDSHRYSHLFEGDGMIQRLEFSEQGIQHRSRYVRTDKFKIEEDAGRFRFNGADTQIPAPLPIEKPDTINVANTSVLPMRGELWALWEGGSAIVLDADTLETKGLASLGQGTAFEKPLQHMPFSAHPKVTPDGHVWNFGFDLHGTVVLYHFNAKGKLEKVKPIATDFRGGMLHDFLVTHKHILLILPSITLKEDGTSYGFFNRIQYAPTQAMEVLVISKDDFSLVKQYELPPAFAYHYGNAWEERNGTIHFDASLYPNADTLQELSWLMRGDRSRSSANAEHILVQLKPDGNVGLERLQVNSEFPVVADHVVGEYNRFLYFVSNQSNSVWHSQINRYDAKRQQLTSFDYGRDFLIEEHLPVCPTHDENKAYLIGTSIHIPSKRSCVSIFKASNLEDGPVARAWLPYSLPLGFHGKFVAS